MGQSYCEAGDLIVGTDVPLPETPSPEQFLQLGAEEIDSQLGLRYLTPIVVPDLAEYRATKLLLKKLNIWLSSGRLIQAQSVGQEGSQVHAYGEKLVKEACEILDRIVSGDIPLPGAQTNDPEDQGRSGPIVNNLDAQSNVESFYGWTQTENVFPFPQSPIFPAGAAGPRSPYTF